MKKRICRKYITGLLVLVAISILVIPTISASSKDFGIVWIYDNDGGLVNTEDDAQGFRDALQSDGWQKVFEKTGWAAHDEQWETSQDQNYVDDTHISYYAGHGWKTYLIIHTGNLPGQPPREEARWNECSWGDENSQKNNWMALATCYAGKWWFGYSMHGTHLVLGWKTECDDQVYGPVFADYLIDNEWTLKSSWFQTGKELGESGNWMRVLGETLSMGNDHLPGHGTVNPDPNDDNIFVFWDCRVPG